MRKSSVFGIAVSHCSADGRWTMLRFQAPKVNYWLPYAVENGAVWEDADVDVRHDDVVEMSFPFIGEEQIGHPHFVRIRQGKVFDFACVIY